VHALADEIEHARLCYGLASAYAGRPLGPGPLAIDRALVDPVDLASVTARAVREGCIGETLAALHAGVRAQAAVDPVVRAVLERIAEDESRHAELAWRFVRWAVAHGGEVVRASVWAELGHASAVHTAAERVALPGDGWVDDDVRGEVELTGMRGIVRPLVRAVAGV